MLSINLIRENPKVVREALDRRDEDHAPLDRIIELDEGRRVILTSSETLRARRNQVSKELSKMKEKPPEVIAEMRQVGSEIKTLETDLKELDEELDLLLLQIPNIPLQDVPSGADESGNVLIKTVGTAPTFEFQPRPHWEIGENLGILDFERGVKMSGSRFYVLKGRGARLQRALISWMLDFHQSQNGYTEIYPPFVVKREALVGSAQLPKFADNVYHDEQDDLWLVPTAEVPLTNLHRDEILDATDLPINYVAYTPCFRREKMSAGRDTRGIKRGHQFDKVEMYKYVAPEDSDEALQSMLSHAEGVAEALGLSHRVLELCAGDLGFHSAKSYDVEVWAPGCEEWLEVSSCSNCLDFQARRANIRYRPKEGARPRYVHTLNGSGTGAAQGFDSSVLETYQQADGSVRIPEVLQCLHWVRPYRGPLAPHTHPKRRIV